MFGLRNDTWMGDTRRASRLRRASNEEDDVSEDWTACASLDGQNNPVIALRLTEGAIVYLHPDMARRFAHQISVALGDEDE